MFLYYFKRIMRDKVRLFWILLFPIALMICFSVAFGNIYEIENSLNPVSCAIVYEEENDLMAKMFNSSFAEMAQNVNANDNATSDDSKKFLAIKAVNSKEEALELLKQEEIKAIYQVGNEKIDILFSANCGETDSMVVRTFANTFLNNYSIISEALKSGNIAGMTKVMEVLNDEMSLVTEKKGVFDSDPNPYQWYFYATLVMAMMFNVQSGIVAISDIQADLSKTAMRTSIAPSKKSSIVASVFGSSYIVAVVISCITLAIMKFVFGVEMGTRIPLLVLFILVGNLFAISTGMVLGMVLKGNVDQRCNKAMAWIMISVFLGGEMMANLPGFFEQMAPVVNDINPATVLNFALYKVTNYEQLGGFYTELVKISVVAVIMLAITIIKVRREKYASL